MFDLVVRAGDLVLESPHGSVTVAIGTPELATTVANLPDGVLLRCEGKGRKIDEFVAMYGTILTDLTPQAATLPDAIVDGDPRLLRARFRDRLRTGDHAGAARDCRSVLRANVAEALDDFEAMPASARTALVPDLARWARKRKADLRFLRWLPLKTWPRPFLLEAFDAALLTGGRYGRDPGTAAADLIDALTANGLDARALATLRHRLAGIDLRDRTSLPTFTVRLPSDVIRVVGVVTEGVYVQREVIPVRPARRNPFAVPAANRPIVSLIGFDGAETHGYEGIVATSVVGELIVDGDGQRLNRVRCFDLASGALRYELTDVFGIGHDAAHLWCRSKFNAASTTETWAIHELERGARVASLTLPAHERIDGITRDGSGLVAWTTSITHVRAERTFGPDGGIELASRILDSLTIVGTSDHEVASTDAPWAAQHGWTRVEAVGWRAYQRGTTLLVGERVPGDRWFAWQLVEHAGAVDLVPPWLVLRRELDATSIRLDELRSATTLQVDGRVLARRAEGDQQCRPTDAMTAWWERLVRAGVVSALPPGERDRALVKRFDALQAPTSTSITSLRGLGRVFYEDEPVLLPPDDLDDVRAIAAADGFELSALRWVGNGDRKDVQFEARRDGRETRYQNNECIWIELLYQLDRAFEQFGDSLRIYRLATGSEDDLAFTIITPAAFEDLIAAGIEGVSALRVGWSPR